MTGNLFPQHSCRGSLEQTLWRRSPLQRLCSFWPRGFGGRGTEANGGSRGLLTDRWVPWWGGSCGQTGHRAQISSVTALLSPATLRVENGQLPVTVSKEAGGELCLRGAGKPLGKEQSYKPYFGVKDLLGNACLPSLLFTT